MLQRDQRGNMRGSAEAGRAESFTLKILGFAQIRLSDEREWRRIAEAEKERQLFAPGNQVHQRGRRVRRHLNFS